MYDTVKGSDFLADQNAVEILAKEAPNAIYTLEHMGVPFSRNAEGKIEQRRFGGHTKNFGEAPIKRACYASDRTGRAIMDTLYDQCLQARRNISQRSIHPTPAFRTKQLLRRRRIRHSNHNTAGFPCQSSCFSYRRMRKNLQNHQQRLRINRRRLRVGA